jgi:hypothetical protein
MVFVVMVVMVFVVMVAVVVTGMGMGMVMVMVMVMVMGIGMALTWYPTQKKGAKMIRCGQKQGSGSTCAIPESLKICLPATLGVIPHTQLGWSL